MKTLFLVRHSKAVTRKPSLPDFKRTLVKAGEKKSTSMAKKLKKEGVMPDLMISSTANRALETAHLFAKNLGYSNKNIEVNEALYNEMSPEALLYIVRHVDDKNNSIMLFGHNPAFTDFASYLVEGFMEDIPKTGIVGIQFKKDNWIDIDKGIGKLAFFEYPKRLSKTYKRLELELQVEIALNVQDVLNKTDPKSARKMKKVIKKSSDRMAKEFLKILKVERAKEERKALAAEKARKRKVKPKPKQKSKAEPKLEAESKLRTAPEAKAKPTPKPESKQKPKSKPEAKAAAGPETITTPKPGKRTRPAAKPKLKATVASKPKTKAPGTAKAAAPKTTKAAAPKKSRQKGVSEQASGPKVRRVRKSTPKAKAGSQGTRTRGNTSQ